MRDFSKSGFGWKRREMAKHPLGRWRLPVKLGLRSRAGPSALGPVGVLLQKFGGFLEACLGPGARDMKPIDKFLGNRVGDFRFQRLGLAVFSRDGMIDRLGHGAGRMRRGRAECKDQRRTRKHVQ